MIKYKEKESTVTKRRLDTILCDRCGKDLKEPNGHFQGVELTIEGESESIIVGFEHLNLCDECYTFFKTQLIHQPAFSIDGILKDNANIN